MRRSSTDETPYRRSPSLDSKPGSPPPNPFRRYSSSYGSPFSFGLHAAPGPQTTKGRYTSPKGNKYVVFYLDLSFILLLELQRCRLARACLGTIKGLMVLFNLLFWLCGQTVWSGVTVWTDSVECVSALCCGQCDSVSTLCPCLSVGPVLCVSEFLCINVLKTCDTHLISFHQSVLCVTMFIESVLCLSVFIERWSPDQSATNNQKSGLSFVNSLIECGVYHCLCVLQFRCCGVSNHTDWFSVYNDTRVPDSCCLEYSENCGLERPDTWWTAPCYKQVKSWMQHNLLSLWVSALCTGVTQILGLAFAMTMLCQVAKCDTFYA
uniref:Tetraspanin 4a n=1 Tax=Lepisosteus oculatus TaxID=7918 RepID=W5LV52_LEPOC